MRSFLSGVGSPTFLRYAALGCAVLALGACSLTAGPPDGAPGDGTTTPSGGNGTGTTGTTPGTGGDAGAAPGTGTTGGDSGTDPTGPAPDAGKTGDAAPPPASTTRVVGYLPNYSGSYATWAKTISFAKMTHLNLAFATANGNNGWDMGASDGEVSALVSAAHAAGTKVLASLGGGGGDQSVIAQFNDGNNVDPLVQNLDAFVAKHGFDGVDIDIEDPGNLGPAYSAFVSAVVARLRPEGKLITAAVAQYLQDSMSDATLRSFDFLNVMIYTNYDDSVSALKFYSQTKSIPKSKLVLGAGFFGTDDKGNEYGYADILKADGNAWNKDQAQVNGATVNYTGMASMKGLAQYAKGFGGIMFWELSEDTTGAHSLYKVIQDAM